ncbi:MAG TPA: hypothetical protein VH597_01930 [Verrucomicrobiae bacterium]|jgi:hypothetical protein|nr:hypothetical protein [Verrucomicrobiae bacterium]
MNSSDSELSKEDYEKGIFQIKERCAKAKITLEEQQGFMEETILEIDFPAGSRTRNLSVATEADVQAFLSTPFETFRLVEGYNALVDYSNGYVEAAVRLPTALSMHVVHRRLFGKKNSPSIPEDELELQNADTLVFKNGKDKSALEARLGIMSKNFQAFATVCVWKNVPFTLQIFGAKLSKNSEALEMLEKIAHALFFEIDLVLNIPLVLEKERGFRGSRTKSGSATGKQLLFPTTKYDPRPMSLYWYARTSRGMPLLQFLAFYQVVEFYYPMFSEKDAIHRLKNILKDPRFDLHSDSDVSKVLRTIKPSPRGFGSELQQLQATIRACVDPKELRAFLSGDEHRKIFYELDYKNVTKQQIPLKNTASDLFLETAQRIYEIRCRIVHTKDLAEDLETEPLLPFSREAEQLYFDIELIEFIAKKVLITASQKFE